MRWYLPNRKDLTPLYLPKERELPAGAELHYFGFDFQNVGAMANAEGSVSFERPYLVWGHNGVYINAALDNAGFRVQLLQQHGGKLLPFFSRHVPNASVLGTGQLPQLLTKPRLFEPGDTLTCEVKCLSANNNSRIQVAIMGAFVGR